MTIKVYIGDTGTVIVLDCGQDISAATVRSIEARRPNGTTVTWSAVASGTTAVSYTSTVETFDMPGEWRLQALVTLPTGKWRGEVARLEVYGVFA